MDSELKVTEPTELVTVTDKHNHPAKTVQRHVHLVTHDVFTFTSVNTCCYEDSRVCVEIRHEQVLAYTTLCGPNIMVQIHSWHKHFVYTVLEVTIMIRYRMRI